MGVRGEIMMIVSLVMVMSSTAINIRATCVKLRLCPQTQQYPPVVDQNQQVLTAKLVLSSAASIANKSSFYYMDLSNLDKTNSCLLHLSSKLAGVRNFLDQIRSQINQQGMLSSTQQIIFLQYSPQDIVDNIVLHAQDPCNRYYKRVLKKLSRSRNSFIRGAAKGGLKAIDASKVFKAAYDFFSTAGNSIEARLPLPRV